MPEAADAQPAKLGGGAALRAAAAATAAGAGGEGGLAGPELLKLAAALRMNTGGEGTRRTRRSLVPPCIELRFRRRRQRGQRVLPAGTCILSRRLPHLRTIEH